tara:strand:- start:155 stop:334 length:180 start_codon:yes stop_codon:yes gene_type:complete
MDINTLKTVVEDLDRILTLTGITKLRGDYDAIIENLEEENKLALSNIASLSEAVMKNKG